jgi:hypothetical protein
VPPLLRLAQILHPVRVVLQGGVLKPPFYGSLACKVFDVVVENLV